MDLYRTIVTTRSLTLSQRELAWNLIENAIAHHLTRPFCRSNDGRKTLPVAESRLFVAHVNAQTLFIFSKGLAI